MRFHLISWWRWRRSTTTNTTMAAATATETPSTCAHRAPFYTTQLTHTRPRVCIRPQQRQQRRWRRRRRRCRRMYCKRIHAQNPHTHTHTREEELQRSTSGTMQLGQHSTPQRYQDSLNNGRERNVLDNPENDHTAHHPCTYTITPNISISIQDALLAFTQWKETNLD